MDDNDINVLTMAGDLCAQLGKYEEAVRHWDKAYACDPSQIACLFSKAEMYASTGRTGEAIRQFEEILAWLEAHGYNMQLGRRTSPPPYSGAFGAAAGGR